MSHETSDLPPLINDRQLFERWCNGRSRTTWWRWRTSGRVPEPDVVLPNGERAWYLPTIIEYERASRPSQAA